MGTETKINCYTKNNTSNGITKVTKGSSAAATQQPKNIVPTTIVANGQNAYCNGKDAKHPVSNGHCEYAAQQQQEGPNNASSVPNVPIFIDENNVIDGAKEILKVIRPDWNLSAVEFKKFTDGITNKLVGCFHNRAPSPAGSANTQTHDRNEADDEDGAAVVVDEEDDNNDSGNLSDSGSDAEHASHDATTSSPPPSPASPQSCAPNNVVLVRVYGNKTDLLIDRKAERRNILLLHSYGFAPSLYATFKNGLAYDYVPGCTLNTSNVLQPRVWSLVARRMAEMHRCVQTPAFQGKEVSARPVPMLWRKTQSFLDLVPERFTDPDKHRRLQGTFLPISRLRNEFETLYKHLEALGSPIVFAHNDLLLGNVVYTEARHAVTFIDYEYADYNFQAFDIGNHFSEFAGVDEVDYARYPSREFQLAWLRVYLETYQQSSTVSDADVERLYVQVNQFALASHLFWVIWSLIQAEHSKIEFDYVDYAFLRYKEYLNRKEQFLALKLPESAN